MGTPDKQTALADLQDRYNRCLGHNRAARLLKNILALEDEIKADADGDEGCGDGPDCWSHDCTAACMGDQG